MDLRYLICEANFNKKLGYFRLKILGLDLGISWTDGHTFCLIFWGRGFGYWFPASLWQIKESYDEFWGYTRQKGG